MRNGTAQPSPLDTYRAPVSSDNDVYPRSHRLREVDNFSEDVGVPSQSPQPSPWVNDVEDRQP